MHGGSDVSSQGVAKINPFTGQWVDLGHSDFASNATIGVAFKDGLLYAGNQYSVGEYMTLNTNNMDVNLNIDSHWEGEGGPVLINFVTFDKSRGDFIVRYSNGTTLTRYLSGNLKNIIINNYFSVPGNFGALDVSEEFGVFAYVEGEGDLKIYSTKNKKFNARLFIQDAQDVDTRREYYTTANVSFLPSSGGAVMRGECAKALMEGINISGYMPDNYLDFIVNLEYRSETQKIAKSSGSASWAYRGYKDIESVFLESDVKIRLLPDFITDK